MPEFRAYLRIIVYLARQGIYEKSIEKIYISQKILTLYLKTM
jgi:hypothetical protein